MSPKEKSIELVNKFYKYTNDGKDGIYYDSKIWTENSKQCALISINEVLDILDYPSEQYSFYINIKQEIEKL